MIEEINAVVEEIRLMLIEKNHAYGNSALEPVRIFSKSDRVEQLKVRIDDKIARVMKGHELTGEATIDDLIGYLVLLKIARRMEDQEAQNSVRGYAPGPSASDGQIFPYQPVQQPPYTFQNGQAADPLDGVHEGLDAYYSEQRFQQ